uniref:Uncharacterized protein n=1 Tax=Aegilops tauschii subsp. strangulata TaxID=200361 RepID=A0A453K1G6_AEGTS
MDLIKNLVSTVIRAVFTYVYSNLRQSCVYWTTCAKAIHTGQMVLKAWCRFRTHFGYNIMGTKNILLENQKHMGAAFEKCSQLSVANIEKAIYNPVTF